MGGGILGGQYLGFSFLLLEDPDRPHGFAWGSWTLTPTTNTLPSVFQLGSVRETPYLIGFHRSSMSAVSI